MMSTPFNWDQLSQWKTSGGFLPGVSADYRTFWSPVDNVHAVLVALLTSATQSVVLNMYGFDDPDLDTIIRNHMLNDRVFVQMSLDSTQAAGAAEKKLLAQWPGDSFGTSIAVGQSSKHAISHLKVCIVDGIYTVSGSTNWSLGGEQKQDNELTLSRDPVRAAEYRSVLDRNHTEMLRQMAAKSGSTKSVHP
jgi:phosphatidylserine/phosphatidylglycerophosphate/cardiolipin synthase-like enzyme